MNGKSDYIVKPIKQKFDVGFMWEQN